MFSDDYAKENRFDNYSRNKKQTVPAKPKRSEIRSRSFRASSVFSNYSLPKRKRNSRVQGKKKHSKYDSRNAADGEDSEVIELLDSRKSSNRSDSDDDEDCELITLRLNALKSKQEFKEPDVPQETSSYQVPEEELLRIDALKSALLKKKDHFMEKKRKRKLEKERPYSPTDDLDKILVDEPMELSNSPVYSPVIAQDDDVNQMDMEISDSSPTNEQVDEEYNLSDMELASSPIDKMSDQLDISEDLEEEKALRSMLLSSISTRRKAEEKNVAMNLKLAVERLRLAQQKQAPSPPPPVTILPPKKSGTKTIKMILEEKKNKKVERPQEFEEQIESENLLLNKINDEQNEVIEKLPTPVVEKVIAAENDILLPTISDTKNIPLLSKVANRRSRVITSLDSVKRPVQPLIITVNAESTDDDSNEGTTVGGGRMVKKTQRKIIRVGNTKSLPKNSHSHQIDIIEKQVESILRKIRLQSEKEKVASPNLAKKAPVEPINNNNTIVKFKSPIKSDNYNLIASSAVNHLPKSAQIEYAMLKEKMKRLEGAKKARQLKRQKSTSISKSANEKDALPIAITIKPAEDVKTKSTQASEKIEDTLSKIQLLDEDARERFASNAENKYLAHSKTLKDSTEEVIKLIDANALELKRRERVNAKIADLEKQLVKFKSMKKVVEQRINVGVPQIVRSQISLIKLRNHQYNFGNMCSRVGEIVRGPSYR